MVGTGLIKGLYVTLRHFIGTYIDDIRWLGKRYYREEALKTRQSLRARGVFTVQYPEEKLVLPDAFRYLPFLVYDESKDGDVKIRCTSCGICTKVCPPQCIWIERSINPETGRPIPEPANFYIDIDICMNCGLCAEFCPFDAIKMDHNYELASYDRSEAHIFDIKRLLQSTTYYRSIRPVSFALEEAARKEGKAAQATVKGGGSA